MNGGQPCDSTTSPVSSSLARSPDHERSHSRRRAQSWGLDCRAAVNAQCTAHLTVSDFCRERLPGGPCTHWKALHRSKLLMQLHLSFSVRTAERLMAIARNPVLTKATTYRFCLRGLGLFYLLSPVDVDRCVST